MPSEVRWPQRLDPGDVLMVARELTDKKTGKPFVWRFFLIVLKHHQMRESVRGLRIGAPDDQQMTVGISKEDDNEVWLLDPDEWPDGVVARRMAAILDGKIEGLL